MSLFKKLQFVFALWAGKVLRILVKMIWKKRGTNLPGSVAIKICPDFLKYFKLPKEVIAVTGSNGKTSTSNYINQILRETGHTTINNSEGSNMPAGIATSLIESSSIFGKCKQDIAVFEVDERASRLIYRYIIPTYLVCTNLFRDSIMRNGHSEFIFNKMQEAIPDSTTLILNGDDLISSALGSDNSNKIFYGVGQVKEDTSDCTSKVCDISVCPICKNKLKYEYVHYHHIGKAYCEKCGFKSPTLDSLAANVDIEGRKFEYIENEQHFEYKFDADTLFNIYNIVASITVCRKLGVTHEDMQKIIEGLKVKSSRKDTTVVKSKTITKMLSKNQNPISCSRTMDYISKLPGDKAIILAITDPNGDELGSEDISWIYDTDFEYLKDEEIKQIIVCGKRAYDVVLALKLAGINGEIIQKQLDYINVEDKINYNKVNYVYILHSLYAENIASEMKNKIVEKVTKEND